MSDDCARCELGSTGGCGHIEDDFEDEDDIARHAAEEAAEQPPKTTRTAADPRAGRDMNYRRGRGGKPYRRAREQCFAHETHCHICGKYVDQSIPYKDPITGKVNVWSKTFDHTVELDRGGHAYAGHLTHWRCNTSKGAKYGNAKRGAQAAADAAQAEVLEVSPDWE